uniref:Bestrophin homolog n=1 Tax=Heterorhabditis bacteriophora TaxID=37862 RepID=A0A1I7WFX8_HETBA
MTLYVVALISSLLRLLLYSFWEGNMNRSKQIILYQSLLLDRKFVICCIYYD